MSPALPAATRTTPNASAYPERIHWSAAELASIDCSIDGRTTLTMDTLSRDRKATIKETRRMRRCSVVKLSAPAAEEAAAESLTFPLYALRAQGATGTTILESMLTPAGRFAPS